MKVQENIHSVTTEARKRLFITCEENAKENSFK